MLFFWLYAGCFDQLVTRCLCRARVPAKTALLFASSAQPASCYTLARDSWFFRRCVSLPAIRALFILVILPPLPICHGMPIACD